MRDYLDPENAKGMPDLMDSAICTEMLITAKSAVNNYAIAITEAVHPELRQTLVRHLDEAIDMQGAISALMAQHNWLFPADPKAQYPFDRKAANTAIDVVSMDLFPYDTDRLGMFATPTNTESKENQQ
ncbi:Coat F domain-containing protein [Terribacillus aidingensis]|uniref:Coat F domain-containing protein n=1 Tax=Terribacillus aidingensis TaxID=586416 RepID=A0A285P5Z3_9BACI|nr:spore coat protein [Terribacillus aidingensis]SNZ17142.1 Coat F domain-containing protein [Terribacillus aidingensis]